MTTCRRRVACAGEKDLLERAKKAAVAMAILLTAAEAGQAVRKRSGKGAKGSG